MTDYISRAEAIELMSGSNIEDHLDSVLTNEPRRYARAAQRVIWSVPAADVVPLVHGRWIKSPDCPEEYDICSVCGLNDKHRTRADGEHHAFESIPLFCKWCGAKMDGKTTQEGPDR